MTSDESSSRPYDSSGVLSMLLAFAALATQALFPLPVGLGVAAVIAGVVGMRRARRDPELKGGTLGAFGILIGIAAAAWSIVG